MYIHQPEILSDSWRSITLKVNGVPQLFKDVIILPSNNQQIALEWNWRWDAEPMQHHPGIRIKDIEQLILKNTPKPDVVILSQGRGHGGLRDNSGPGILEVSPDLKTYLQQKGIKEIYILKTAQAIEKYNEIQRLGKKHIAALIHTTC